MKIQIAPPETLNILLTYDAKTGFLYWRERTPEFFSDGGNGSEANCATWNARYANQLALHAIWSNGYRCGRLFDKAVPAHRAIIAMNLGFWPDEVDHINGDRLDNRLDNLRPVSRSENAKNQKRPAHNSSGHIGVGWHKAAQKWRAYIKSGHRDIHLGLFDTIEDARKARASAEAEHSFHKNHGR